MPRKHSQNFIFVYRTPLTTFGKNLNTKRQVRLEYDATNNFSRLWGYAALKNWFLVEIYERFSHSRCMKIRFAGQKKESSLHHFHRRKYNMKAYKYCVWCAQKMILWILVSIKTHFDKNRTRTCWKSTVNMECLIV